MSSFHLFIHCLYSGSFAWAMSIPSGAMKPSRDITTSKNTLLVCIASSLLLFLKIIFAQVVPQNELETCVVFWFKREFCGSHLMSFLLRERFAPFCVSIVTHGSIPRTFGSCLEQNGQKRKSFLLVLKEHMVLIREAHPSPRVCQIPRPNGASVLECVIFSSGGIDLSTHLLLSSHGTTRGVHVPSLTVGMTNMLHARFTSTTRRPQQPKGRG